ncbi:MAG: 5-methyltetrahydropteroyltriglutamate--homocysteine methyltransferase [Alphaproteobacteria bacterium]|nr:5-methyltetrahydropteroyltriglutamate--homocysteine methyltransferase [Alphaproteobacteria bacterium]
MSGTPASTLLPTTLVGSYPQPEWLIDRKRLTAIVPPRAHARDLWRVDPPWLEQAQDDATLLAIRDQERAGIDIVTDGEMRRESYSNRFATALEGMDGDNPAQIPSRTRGKVQIVPRVVGKIRRRRPVQVRDVAFLRANTDRPIRITIPGPFTMTQQLFDEHYRDEAAVATDCAIALNEEIKDLFAAGADVVQLDEPFLEAYPDKARSFGVSAINRAIEGVGGVTAVHLCFGYGAMVRNKPSGYSFLAELEATKIDQVSIETAQSKLDCSALAQLPGKHIVLGVLDLNDPAVETPAIVAGRIRRALPYVPAERLIVAPDCGLKYLPRDVAFAKLQAMVEGAAIVRRELGR